MPTQNHAYRLTVSAAYSAATYSLFPVPYSLNFTFSSKERDSETGLSYFGARYYSSDLSIWLSVDPQAAKYPGLSPFTYCANNPIKLVDPNGEEIDNPDNPPKNIFQKGWESFKKFDQSLEGHHDGANRGTITKQDVEVGIAVVATMATIGAGLEAEGAASAIITGMATINNIDDATVNTSGQTFLERTTADKPIANKTITIAKTVSPAASLGSSTITIIEKGLEKAASSTIDAVMSAYGFVKSLFSKKESNDKS